jgi:single-stranded-DNA-specific exonuclease
MCLTLRIPRIQENALRWIYADNKTIEPKLESELKEKLGLPDYIIKVFLNRGIDTFEKAREVLELDSAPFDSPSLFEDMEKALKRIKKAVAGNEKITVYGDYDVDGVTAIVTLFSFFKEYFKYDNIEYYIPHRQDEGYGLNIEAVKSIKEAGTSLIITVDCGISARAEIDFCVNEGIDVIVTDHHLPGDGSVPDKAVAIINPKVSKTYPDKDLSGVGVVYKLVCGLAQDAKIDLRDEYLEFVAMGTVADIVPLSRENRKLVRRGFKRIEKTSNTGLIALKEAAKIAKDTVINTYHVGFILGPRINAAGRLEHARRAVDLFLSKDIAVVEQIASDLNGINDERKRLMKAAEEEAINMFKDKFRPDEDFVIVLYNEMWNAGIVGLVASKVLRHFNRPVFILTKSEDGMVHGSARSVPSVNIYEAIRHAAKHLERYGGHKLAAGIKLKEENIEKFRISVNDFLKGSMTRADFESILEIDSRIESALNLKDIKIFDRLQPWGEGNPKPVFTMENVDIKDVRFYKSNTMKFYGKHNGKFYNFILFGHDEEDKEKIKQGDVITVAFTPGINVWQGDESLCLEVVDVK